jgi:HSP20 family protein
MPGSHQSGFRGLYDVFAEMGRMREHVTHADPSQDQSTGARAWVPATDIFVDGDNLVIRCELAGVPKSDVNVSLSGGQLWISGERKGAPDADDRSFYVRERRYGPFRRIITLPETAVGDRITATVEDGLLEIVVEGGAAADDHQQIEIAGAESAEIRLDVAGDG